MGLVGKRPSHGPPFNLHDRPRLGFKYQMAGADLSYFPFGRGFKTDSVPGDLFPMISQFSNMSLFESNLSSPRAMPKLGASPKLECWKTGYEKRKMVYSIKNVVSTFYDDASQTSIIRFCPRNYATITKKINLN